MRNSPALARWWPAIAWMALIFFLSSQPKLPEVPGLNKIDWGDKILHAVFYAVLGALVWRALRGLPSAKRFALAVLAAVVYGLTDEFHQLYVPGRSFDMLDLAADGLGAILACAVLAALSGGDDYGRRRESARKPD